jgi:hypothetical protein
MRYLHISVHSRIPQMFSLSKLVLSYDCRIFAFYLGPRLYLSCQYIMSIDLASCVLFAYLPSRLLPCHVSIYMCPAHPYLVLGGFFCDGPWEEAGTEEEEEAEETVKRQRSRQEIVRTGARSRAAVPRRPPSITHTRLRFIISLDFVHRTFSLVKLKRTYLKSSL